MKGYDKDINASAAKTEFQGHCSTNAYQGNVIKGNNSVTTRNSNIEKCAFGFCPLEHIPETYTDYFMTERYLAADVFSNT
jgi:hypothetical protein